jgi:hypothetical protein
MKKHILRFGLIFVIFAAVFIACQQELFEKETHDSSLSVEDAQAWFEAS